MIAIGITFFGKILRQNDAMQIIVIENDNTFDLHLSDFSAANTSSFFSVHFQLWPTHWMTATIKYSV